MNEKRWNQNFADICQYLEEHNCRVDEIPRDVRGRSGTLLKVWIDEMRKSYLEYESARYTLDDEKREKLRSIGLGEIVLATEQDWLMHLMEVRKFYEEHQTFTVPSDFLSSDGTTLRAWVQKQRNDYRNGKLKSERFQKIQELGLTEMLESSFESCYRYAVAFYEENHHLCVPCSYCCEDGYKLGVWIRELRYKFHKNWLSQEKIDKLNAIGMIWNMMEYRWQEVYEDCRAYYEEHGNLDFSYSYRGKSDTLLKNWLRNCQREYQDGTLSPEHTDQLNEIHALENMPIFQKKEHTSETPKIDTDTVILYVKKFLQKHHHLCIPLNYVCEDGYELGKWASTVRARYKSGRISQKLFQELDRMGMVWDNNLYYWQKVYEDCKEYYEQHGNLNMPSDYKGTSGVSLKNWIRIHCRKSKKGELSQEQIDKLNAIHVLDTSPKIPSQKKPKSIQHAEQFLAEHQHLCIPSDYVCADGFRLGKWARSARTRYHKGELAKETIEMLDNLGMVWNLMEYHWDEIYQDCQSYYEQHGNLNIPIDYKGTSDVLLRNWLFSQRVKHRQGKLSQERIDKLNLIHALEIRLKSPITKRAASDKSTQDMEQGLLHINQFYEKHQHLCFSNDYVCNDGYALGKFAKKLRNAHRNETLSTEITEQLEKIGFYWNYRDQIWISVYQDCKAYLEEYGNLDIPSDMQSKSGLNMRIWLKNNRRAYHNGTLSEEKVRLMENLDDAIQNYKKSNKSEYSEEELLQIWEENCMEIKSFYETYHHVTIPASLKSKSGVSLRLWFVAQRNILRANKMSEQKIAFLNEQKIIHLFQPQYHVSLSLSQPQHDSLQEKAVHAGYETINEYLMSLIETAESI